MHTTREELVDIDARLHRFFLPQIDQLALQMHAVPGGAAGACASPWGSGRIWAGQIGDGCLVTAHVVELARDMQLVENPPESLCLSLMSADAMRVSPLPPGARSVEPAGNVALFAQGDAPIACDMRAGQVFECVSVCMLPEHVDGIARRFGEGVAAEVRSLLEEEGVLVAGESAAFARAVLRSAGSLPASGACLGSVVERQVDGTVALLACERAEERRARAGQGLGAQVGLVARATALIEANPADPPSIEALAEVFHISRARLCAAFKAETGEGPGSLAQRLRIERACSLLVETRLSVAEVAAAVGYRHQSSFADAFRRATGATPSAWRARHAG